MKMILTIIGYLLVWGIGLSYVESLVCGKLKQSKGLIAFNRNYRWRGVSAIVITLILALWFHSKDDVITIFTPIDWVVEAVSIFAGFYATPYVLRFFAKWFPILSAYADKLEAGEANLVADLQSKLNTAKETVVDTVKKEDEKYNNPEDNRSFKDKMKDSTKDL